MTAISGGRKPTADSTAYTLYKPNKQNMRSKISNGGGSIAGTADGSFDAGYAAILNNLNQNNIVKLEKQANSWNHSNFASGPNTTASRFYNPNKQI